MRSRLSPIKTALDWIELDWTLKILVQFVSIYRAETNVFEACASGASVAGKTVGAVLINYIAFISILAFLNSTLSWLGSMVDYPELSFEVHILSPKSNLLPNPLCFTSLSGQVGNVLA